jgi:hypothetical protein
VDKISGRAICLSNTITHPSETIDCDISMHFGTIAKLREVITLANGARSEVNDVMIGTSAGVIQETPVSHPLGYQENMHIPLDASALQGKFELYGHTDTWGTVAGIVTVTLYLPEVGPLIALGDDLYSANGVDLTQAKWGVAATGAYRLGSPPQSASSSADRLSSGPLLYWICVHYHQLNE